MRDQDQALDGLGAVVGNLGAMGEQIHVELVNQGQMIEELDNEVDQTQGRLAHLTKNINKLLKDSDNKQLCMIAVLIIVLVILIVFTFMK